MERIDSAPCVFYPLNPSDYANVETNMFVEVPRPDLAHETHQKHKCGILGFRVLSCDSWAIPA